MTTTMKNEPKSAIKPVGRLDASMLLARKGEATPAVRATSQNNPDLAWGMSSSATAQTVHSTPENAPHTPTEPRAPHRAKPTASARLRPDSFRPPQGHERTPGGPAVGKRGASPIALTLRVDEDAYLRLAYLAECTGFSLTRVLQDALDNHLMQCRVPKAGKLTVRPK